MQRHVVECEECGARFRAQIGWQLYEAGRLMGLEARVRATKGHLQVRSTGRRDEVLVRVRLRYQRCGWYADGTQGCAGRLKRLNSTRRSPGAAALSR